MSYTSLITLEQSTISWDDNSPGFDWEHDQTREYPIAELDRYLMALVQEAGK